MKSLFEILRRSERPNYSLNAPSGADAARGIAFQESATAGTAELADGTVPIAGFVTRQVLITGPILDDAIYPDRIELPFKAGEEASFEYAEAVECEGGDGSAAQSPVAPSYVKTASTGAIASNTALKSPLSFVAGQFAVAQSGQFAEFILVELPTPVLTSNVRIRVQRIPGYKVP